MTKKKFFSKKFILFITGLVVAILIVAVVIPVGLSDGIEKFNGQEKQLAQKALDSYIQESNAGINKVGSIGIFKTRAESIIKNNSTGTGLASKCNPHYEVQISERTFFGLVGNSGVRQICLSDL